MPVKDSQDSKRRAADVIFGSGHLSRYSITAECCSGWSWVAKFWKRKWNQLNPRLPSYQLSLRVTRAMFNNLSLLELQNRFLACVGHASFGKQREKIIILLCHLFFKCRRCYGIPESLKSATPLRRYPSNWRKSSSYLNSSPTQPRSLSRYHRLWFFRSIQHCSIHHQRRENITGEEDEVLYWMIMELLHPTQLPTNQTKIISATAPTQRHLDLHNQLA